MPSQDQASWLAADWALVYLQTQRMEVYVLIKMLGGFVLVRLISWIVARFEWGTTLFGKLIVTHGVTFSALMALELAVRLHVGGISFNQVLVFVPGSLFWLSFDMVTTLSKAKPEGA